MRSFYNILFLGFITNFLGFSLKSQSPQHKKLIQQLWQAKTDTAKVNCLNNIALNYLSYNNDSTLFFSKKALEIAIDENYINGKTKAYINMANAYRHLDSTKRCLAILNLVLIMKLQQNRV